VLAALKPQNAVKLHPPEEPHPRYRLFEFSSLGFGRENFLATLTLFLTTRTLERISYQ